MIDLQLKKARLDQQQTDKEPEATVQTAQGMVLSRNDLLERIIAGNNQKDKKE
jgi:hypothetical protein